MNSFIDLGAQSESNFSILRNKTEEKSIYITSDTAFSSTPKKLDTFIGWWDLSGTRNRFSPCREAIVGRPTINQRCKRRRAIAA